MKLKKLATFTAGVVTGAALAVGGSHIVQINNIENRTEQIRTSIGAAQGSTREDLRLILEEVNCSVDCYGGDQEFWFGDFETRETEHGTEARCGGLAKRVLEVGARYGFRGTINMERSGYHLHYYAILVRDGDRFRIDGNVGQLRYREVE